MWVPNGLVAGRERRSRYRAANDGLEFSPALDCNDTVVFISAMADFESTIYVMLSVSAPPGVDAASWCSDTRKPAKTDRNRLSSFTPSCMESGEERVRDVYNLGKKVLALCVNNSVDYNFAHFRG
jgi:hypothetical protein